MSIRVTESLPLLPTQTEPPPAANPYGSPPTWMRAVTRFVAGSSRSTVPERKFAIQTEPAASTSENGRPPTSIWRSRAALTRRTTTRVRALCLPRWSTARTRSTWRPTVSRWR
jgi:hypothetical protein